MCWKAAFIDDRYFMQHVMAVLVLVLNMRMTLLKRDKYTGSEYSLATANTLKYSSG